MTRLAVGYLTAAELVAFLRNEPAPAAPFADQGALATVVLVYLGGLAANLTPCVLPLVPVNLAILLGGDASASKGMRFRRGLAYGLGIALSYGALGLAAAFGGVAVGSLQSSPWFSAFVALMFLVLAACSLDLVRLPPVLPKVAKAGRKAGPFLLGAGSAALASACVEPILLATLLHTASNFAAGERWTAVLPFVLGAGMATPWPFAAAGLAVLPRPGSWMLWVKRAFTLVLVGGAFWYGRLACMGWRGGAESDISRPTSALAPTGAGNKPRFYKIGAPWCRACTAMDRETMRDGKVLRELSRFEVHRVEINDFDELKKHSDLADVDIAGLPACVVVEAESGKTKAQSK